MGSSITEIAGTKRRSTVIRTKRLEPEKNGIPADPYPAPYVSSPPHHRVDLPGLWGGHLIGDRHGLMTSAEREASTP